MENILDRTDKRGGDFDAMDVDRLKAKLAKLVKAQEGAEAIGNIAEAEMFADRISRLFEKYSLTIDDVSTPVMGMTLMDPMFHRLTMAMGRIPWHIRLATSVAEYVGCRVLFPDDKGNNQLLFVGTTRDRNTAINLFTHLVRLGNSFSKAEMSIFRKANRGESVKGFKDTFVEAFADKLISRLSASPKQGNIDLISEFISEIYGYVKREDVANRSKDHEAAAAAGTSRGDRARLSFAKEEK